jgi:hypothetical protein
LQGNICTFGQTMIQSQKLATEYGSKGVAIGSGQTMVQKWPNDGSSHTRLHAASENYRGVGE